ncbi:HlyD family secretion protein [Rhizomicrobium palustre]|uniref:HlyD family secretion protein n=1 Tax=Rhizomicrobium palustre TaxID=189966 RepID=A0A846MVN4_9PROT|nr:HlyD family efflux transporter periplasmic adaptor subunit [Rhizomicrobium palustre]NIK87152.1 HlyD family secretion protein [Rhizomicrobium palustre]
MDQIIARKSRWPLYGSLAGIAVLAGALAIWLMSGTGGNTLRVSTNQLTIGTVTEGPFEDYIAVRGRIAPFMVAHLTTDQGGTVKQVLVEDGAIVKKGQALLVLSNPALQLQVASQQLQFEQTRYKYQQDLLDIEHKLSQLRNNLTRDKMLLDANAIAPSTYKQEQDDYNYYLKLRATTVASRDVQQRVLAAPLIGQSSDGKGNIDISNAAVEALTIRAPMDGQLTDLDAEVGQSKVVGAVLGQVNSADHFKLVADVDQFYLNRVSNGQETLFSVSGRDYRAKVAKVYPQVTNGTFKVDFYFDGAAPQDTHVGQEMDMKVELGGASRALMLPSGPFYQDTGGSWVFVVASDGKSAVRRSVRLGRRNPDHVEVLDGLKPGEKVIVSGYEAYLKMDRLDLTNSKSDNL